MIGIEVGNTKLRRAVPRGRSSKDERPLEYDDHFNYIVGINLGANGIVKTVYIFDNSMFLTMKSTED